MKIVRWNDINFWALKSAVAKTHKTLHKHMKEFEIGLSTGVQNFLNANIKDWITEGGEGVWDKVVTPQLNRSAIRYSRINEGKYVHMLKPTYMKLDGSKKKKVLHFIYSQSC